jgi:hypothetical protein
MLQLFACGFLLAWNLISSCKNVGMLMHKPLSWQGDLQAALMCVKNHNQEGKDSKP